MASQKKLRTTLFIPTRNEVDGVKHIMPRVKREWVDEIVIIDRQSTDGTVEYFEKMGYAVIQQKSRTFCGAYWECVEVATGDVIIPFSPDNNSLPELIPLLVEKMEEGNDLVIASRYLGNAKSEDDDVVTAFGNWMFTRLVRLFYGGAVTDSLVMYRAFRKQLFDELRLDEKKMPTLEYQMLIRCLLAGKRIAEIPGDEPKRIGGVRKMRPLYNGSCLLYRLFRELRWKP